MRMIEKMACGIALAACAFMAAQAGDVYSKAFYWVRGMGVDANGNGKLDSGELYDSLNLHEPAEHQNGGGRVVFTNETVKMPYRGVRRQMQGIYLPQTVVVTNEANSTGYMYPDVFRLPSFVVNAITNRPNFAFAIRFRPDMTRPNKDYEWLINIGHALGRGMMVGLAAKSANVQSCTSNGERFYFTNYLSSVHFYYGAQGCTVNNGANAKFGAGVWNDLVVSVNGQDVAFFVSRDGDEFQDESSNTNSSAALCMSTLYHKTIPDTVDVSPKAGSMINIGSESYVSDKYAWATNNAGNATKSFRGTIQSIAFWTNSLTEAEMREAAAWPRTDLWRVGVENGSVGEFNGEGSSVVLDVDEDRWSVPKAIPAGGSVTFRFPLDSTGEAAMPQVFRLVPTEDSPSGMFKVKVNGTVVGTRAVSPGKIARWFVPETMLLAGATNTLELTRTDSGASSVKIDTAVFGGSLQYGKRDGANMDFAMEGRYQDKVNYWLIGANWYDGNRAIFGTGTNSAGKSTSHTNTCLRFSVPSEILSNYDWGIKFRTIGTGNVNMELNGVDLGTYTSHATHEFAVPEGLMQSDNSLRISNTRPYVQGVYFAPDYLSLYLVERPSGTMLLLR